MWVDLAILVVLAVSALGGIAQGFIRAFCSLIGLLLGLALAAWNYGRLARVFMPIVQIEGVANAFGFLVIALLVIALASLFGVMLKKTIRWMGLGCLDRIAGAVLGFLQGAIVVMVCIMVTLAFYPHTRWLSQAQLPQYFLGVCHLSASMSPADLAGKVREGMGVLEKESPKWMNPPNGK